MGKSKGGKQSALKQLRSALSNAGITGPTSSSRKVHKKNKGSKPANDRGHKLQAIQAAFNPFEMKIDKTKFDVLGLKRKTQVNVSVARQRALEKRKNTLGQELAKRNRVGGISDRRIGENDPTMDPEEKMIRRFALERQRRSAHAGGGGSGKRSSMFSLEENSDIEGEITSLTHFGRSIDEINEFGEGEAAEAFEVTAEHFGAAGLAEAEADGEGPARKKTKAEVMMEVIAKSKQHKYERQLAKEEDDGLRRELDDDFESVRALLFASAGDAKPMQKAAAAAEGDADSASNNVDKSYDAHVREMVYEQRARPQNRLKTEEELAREEVQRLERAERHRQRRMDGIPSDTEPESDSDGDELAAYKAKQKRFPVADDLGDDFAKAQSDSEDNGEDVELGGGLAAAASQSGGDDDSGVSDDGSDASDDGSDVSDDGAEDEEEEPCAVPAKKTGATASSAASKEDAEMPYTFDAPSDYDAWVSLVGKYSLEQQLVAIRRLRTLYHIRLAPQNKQKLGDLAIILVDYIAVLAEQDPPISASVVDEIVKHIGELAPIDADRFGEHCRLQVIEIQKRIADAIKGSGGSSQAAAALAASDIALMRVFVAVFSASDRFHSVITPILLAIGQYLSQFAFATPASIAGALVLVGT
ncbi:nucleolar complex protein 14, partial [Coemansia sp. RSA 2559]